MRPRAARSIIERVAGSADQWLDGLAGLPFDKARIDKLERVIQTGRGCSGWDDTAAAAATAATAATAARSADGAG